MRLYEGVCPYTRLDEIIRCIRGYERLEIVLFIRQHEHVCSLRLHGLYSVWSSVRQYESVEYMRLYKKTELFQYFQFKEAHFFLVCFTTIIILYIMKPECVDEARFLAVI